MKKPLTNEESSAIILGQSKIWCSSQVVRPRSATPLSAGSNPAVTSKEKGIPSGIPFFFPLEMTTLDLSRFRIASRKECRCTFAAQSASSSLVSVKRANLSKTYPAVALAVGIFVLERSVALAPTFREPLHTFFTGEY